jgi:hypothetical protein
MGLKERRCENVGWIHLAQDRIQRWALVEHGNKFSGSIKRE